MTNQILSKNMRFRLVFSLYLNYIIHGFGLIILAQNMTTLSDYWSTSLKMVSFVISGIGIGRLLAYLITGYLSDKLSRKFFVYLGMACYLFFAIGIVSTKSIIFAYFCAILAGIANSALDAGTYTTLVELNDGNGQATVLIKAFVSVGEFILPLLIAAIHGANLWFGWSFISMVVLLILNAILLIPLKFPQPYQNEKNTQEKIEQRQQSNLGRIIATGALVLYGYTSMALMIWFTQWITLFGEKVAGFNTTQAHLLLSLYSVGSILGVLCLYIFLNRNISEGPILIIMNILATLALGIILLSHTPLLSHIASLLFGFSAAGGIMQTGLTVFMKLYPTRRGFVTGIFYFFGAIASFTEPLISGALSDISIQVALGGDFFVGLIGICLVTVINFASRQALEM